MGSVASRVYVHPNPLPSTRIMHIFSQYIYGSILGTGFFDCFKNVDYGIYLMACTLAEAADCASVISITCIDFRDFAVREKLQRFMQQFSVFIKGPVRSTLNVYDCNDRL